MGLDLIGCPQNNLERREETYNGLLHYRRLIASKLIIVPTLLPCGVVGSATDANRKIPGLILVIIVWSFRGLS